MFSVIVPIYNVEKYLSQCIESLINQTYRDIEIILVNDGSTDTSGAICDRYAQKDKRIKVVHKKNDGLGMARNSGLEIATGKFVSFVDSDDYLKEDVIEKLVESLNRESADTCIGGYIRVNNEGEFLLEEKFAYECFSKENVQKKLFPRLMGSTPNCKDAIRPSVWNSAYSMDIIKAYSLRFPSEREYIAEDIVFDIEYYRYAKKVVLIESSGYMYRVTPSSLTQQYKPDRYEKIKYLYNYVFYRLKELGYGDDVIERAKRQYFVYVRSCFYQECHSKSVSFWQAVKHIRDICNDTLLQSCITSYPCRQLTIQPRIFLGLIRNKMSVALYLLLSIKKSSGQA